MELTPRRHGPDDPALGAILDLIRESFAFMDGRIDPPSSMLNLTPEALSHIAATAEVWSLGPPPLACVILTPKAPALYLGKLAVAPHIRGRGYARQLIELAEARAGAQGFDRIELQTRVELPENHATFGKLGFVEVGRTAHPGFDRPTSITFRKLLA